MALTNAQHDTIMQEYDRLRRTRARMIAQRTEEIYAKIPRFREIDLLIPEEGARAGIAMVEGQKDALTRLKSIYTDASDEKRRLLEENGFPASYLDVPFHCPDCQDTGYVGQTRCRCFEQKKHDLLYASSDLKTLLSTNNFDIMSDSYFEGEDLGRFKKALARCMRFIDGFQTEEGYGNLLFFGPVGSGKSFLSIATAGKLMERGALVRYYSAVQLFEELSAATFDREADRPRGALTRELIDCDLLIIDDLGTELTNAFVSTQLFHLINERDLKKHATIISTNFDLDELRARYSDRVFSRLAKNYTICELSGRDIRLLQTI